MHNIRGFGSLFGDKNVVCQICLLPDHVAYKCRNMFNYGFIPRQRRGNLSGFRPRDSQLVEIMEEVLA